MKWLIAFIVTVVGIIIILAVGSAFHDIVVSSTQNIMEPFRTIFSFPFEVMDAVFKFLLPFLR
jgi:hypothetical protein